MVSKSVDSMVRHANKFTMNDHEDMACNETGAHAKMQNSCVLHMHVLQMMPLGGVASAVPPPSYGVDALGYRSVSGGRLSFNNKQLKKAVSGGRLSFNNKQLKKALERKSFKQAAQQHISFSKVNSLTWPFPHSFLFS